MPFMELPQRNVFIFLQGSGTITPRSQHGAGGLDIWAIVAQLKFISTSYITGYRSLKGFTPLDPLKTISFFTGISTLPGHWSHNSPFLSTINEDSRFTWMPGENSYTKP